MEGRGRSPEERQAAAEARARAREGRPEPGDEEVLETPSHRPGPMSRYGSRSTTLPQFRRSVQP